MKTKEEKIKIREKKEPLKLKELLAKEDFIKIPKVGDIVRGRVIDISKSGICLDIDGLTTGLVRGQELYDESKEYSNLKIGDEVEAMVIDLENENGEMELSFRIAGHQKAWEKLKKLKEEKVVVLTNIIEANKGGLMIKLGQMAGFLPVSQLAPEHYPRVPGGDKNKILERLKSYIGQKFRVIVLDTEEAEEKLIVSEKAAWEKEHQDVISHYKVGDIIEGEVMAITDFGIFIKFGQNLEGLVHISELAWQRIDNPTDFVKVGDKIKAQIINTENSKIFLSMKKLVQDPWKKIEEKYKVGQVVKGKVLKINPFGLFVELDPDIHGLAHISELADYPVNNPEKIAKVGEVLDFKILSIEPVNHRLGLSLKALKENKNKGENSK